MPLEVALQLLDMDLRVECSASRNKGAQSGRGDQSDAESSRQTFEKLGRKCPRRIVYIPQAHSLELLRYLANHWTHAASMDSDRL